MIVGWIAMFVGAVTTETGGENKIFETIFTEEREGGRIEGRLTCVPEKTRKILRVSNRISISRNKTKSAF
jgi:hypothetical protein